MILERSIVLWVISPVVLKAGPHTPHRIRRNHSRRNTRHCMLYNSYVKNVVGYHHMMIFAHYFAFLPSSLDMCPFFCAPALGGTCRDHKISQVTSVTFSPPDAHIKCDAVCLEHLLWKRFPHFCCVVVSNRQSSSYIVVLDGSHWIKNKYRRPLSSYDLKPIRGENPYFFWLPWRLQ